MYHSDLLSCFNNLSFLCKSYALSNDLVSIISWNGHAHNSSADVHLSYNSAILGAGENLHLWSVLPNQSSKFTCIGQHNDECNILLIKHC